MPQGQHSRALSPSKQKVGLSLELGSGAWSALERCLLFLWRAVHSSLPAPQGQPQDADIRWGWWWWTKWSGLTWVTPGDNEVAAASTAAKSLQSYPTLCDPIDGSPPGSAVPGILQARTLESVAISFSNAWKWKVKVKLLSRVRFLATPWTAAYQAPPSMDFPGKSTAAFIF